MSLTIVSETIQKFAASQAELSVCLFLYSGPKWQRCLPSGNLNSHLQSLIPSARPTYMVCRGLRPSRLTSTAQLPHHDLPTCRRLPPDKSLSPFGLAGL